MSNSKLTQRDYFNELIDLCLDNERDDLADFCRGRIEVLDRKGGKVSKKRAEEIDTTTKQVYDALVGVGKAVTVSELVKTATNEVSEMSGQRVSAYLKKLVDSGKAVKTVEKKVSYFKAVPTEEPATEETEDTATEE